MEPRLHLGLLYFSTAVRTSRELEKNAKKSCSRVQIVRSYTLHCRLEDMSLLQGINQIFTFITSVLFKRKQLVLLSLSLMVSNTAQAHGAAHAVFAP